MEATAATMAACVTPVLEEVLPFWVLLGQCPLHKDISRDLDEHQEETGERFASPLVMCTPFNFRSAKKSSYKEILSSVRTPELEKTKTCSQPCISNLDGYVKVELQLWA